MAQRILVVDCNAAFATMLKEMLETEGGYQVRVAPGGSAALALLERDRFDLTIVDMDLDPEEMGYRDLIRRVRRVLPGMRLVLIPLMGQAVPSEAHELNVQGTLSKPFFADDLLPRIKEALSAPLAAPPVAAPPRVAVPPAPASRPARSAAGVEPASRIQELLLDLARETRADLVAVLSLQGRGRVVAQVGTVGKEAESLAGLSLGALQAAQRLARFLGQPDLPFEHNMFESESFRLYLLSLPGNLGLLLAAPLGAPLGAVRQNLRRIGRELASMPLT
ncbi:MAG TPA: response regulator [Anaerolineae bacterium]|nr:response regulator [Anaerolineae bacterium]